MLFIMCGAGVVYYNECPVQHYIPLYLVICGSLALLMAIFALIQSVCLYQQNDSEDEQSEGQPEDPENPEDVQSPYQQEDLERDRPQSEQMTNVDDEQLVERERRHDEREKSPSRQKTGNGKRRHLSRAWCGSESFVGSVVSFCFTAGKL